MPFEKRFSDANAPAAQFVAGQPRYDQIAPMLTSAERHTMSALGSCEILRMDQGHLTTIG